MPEKKFVPEYIRKAAIKSVLLREFPNLGLQQISDLADEMFELAHAAYEE
jgi:hypothetical protein